MNSMKRTRWPLPRKWRAIGTTLSSLTPRLTTMLISIGPSPAAAATFYAGVFGWEVEKGTPAGTVTRYDMCRLRGSDVAAIGSPTIDAEMHTRATQRSEDGVRACPFGQRWWSRPRTVFQLSR